MNNEIIKIEPISPSTLMRPIVNLILDKIPRFILDQAADYGKQLMEDLEQNDVIGEALQKENSKVVKKAIETELGKIKEIEYEFSIGKWKGFVDVVTEDALVEIKTRSNDSVRWSDRVQCLIYHIALNKPIWLLIYNKKEDKINHFKMMRFNKSDYEKLDALYKLYLAFRDERGLYYYGRAKGKRFDVKIDF